RVLPPPCARPAVPRLPRPPAPSPAELGGIDAFVNCAAVGTTVPHEEATVHHVMDDVDERAWNAMSDVNARSGFFAVRRLSRLMRGNGGGNIVLLGSIDGVKP